MVGAGALCVTMDGTFGMPRWPAGSWAAGGHWLPLGEPDLGLVQGQCGWMMWGVEEENRPSGTVPEAPGAGATVTTVRTPGWSALVCWGRETPPPCPPPGSCSGPVDPRSVPPPFCLFSPILLWGS
jgi:hypothetical protein